MSGQVGAIASSGFTAAANPLAPLTILGGTNFFYFNADVEAASDGSSWGDQSGNNFDAIQATGANQPILTAGALNGKAVYQFNTVRNMAVVGWNPPLPGTTPIWFWGVWNQLTRTNGEIIYSCSSVILRCSQGSASNNLSARNGAVGPTNNGGTLGSYFRSENLFSNTTADYLKCGASSVTGTNTLNNDGSISTFRIGDTGGLSNKRVACFLAHAGDPSTPVKNALDAWVTDYYGSGVLI